MKNATSPYNLRFLRRGPLACFMAVALAALLGTTIASAQTGSPASHLTTVAAGARPQAAAKSAPHGEEESEAKPNDSNHQGVKIHGHWKIDIKNADGSLASTHEFENSLYDYGTLLSYLLTSKATSGEAAIQVLTCATTQCPTSSTYISFIAESSTGYWANYQTGNWQGVGFYGQDSGFAGNIFSSNLNVSLVVTPDSNQIHDYYNVVLTGSVVAPSNSFITEVATAFAACNNSSGGLATVTPAQCHSGTVPAGTSVNSLYSNDGTFPDFGVLTHTKLSSPPTVLSGQTMQFTVTLSFS